ncbi:MAG: hypothetical protein DWQ34_03265, partial [Planctomycetota bacterium]
MTEAATVDWDTLITEAIETPDAVLSNFRITRVHYLLSTALQEAVGPDAGANFHSWAVWGSRKAGITIRKADKDQASRDAMIVAGVVGGAVGAIVGWLTASTAGWSITAAMGLWVPAGTLAGGGCGRLLAAYTRNAASRSILEGNRTVLDDIGRLTARYLAYAAAVPQPSSADFDEFLAKFTPGPTDEGGQDLLRRAFEQYEAARRSSDPKVRHEANYFANCLAVLHEHIRLQPYISRSLPFLIKKCVTERLMTYSVGKKQLAVHEDVPPLAGEPFPATLKDLQNKELNEFLNGPHGWDPGRGTLANTRAR